MIDWTPGVRHPPHISNITTMGKSTQLLDAEDILSELINIYVFRTTPTSGDHMVLAEFNKSFPGNEDMAMKIDEWLDENNVDIKNYKINSYAPTYYDIQLMFDRYVIAEIGGDSWAHMLVFKFINEDGTYRLIPKGISTVSEDYIDPWYDVKSYIRQEE